ncbi:hypothetical protein HMPREF9058_2682 [Actinomyces sp. oral taxon 175 str. F0384]|nr:hypothetical protein HMPREF9058_2682 [Actinomyces sp. oral taxon 175 str. F0384]
MRSQEHEPPPSPRRPRAPHPTPLPSLFSHPFSSRSSQLRITDDGTTTPDP